MVGGWDTKNSHSYSVAIGVFNILAVLPFILVPNILRLTLTQKKLSRTGLNRFNVSPWNIVSESKQVEIPCAEVAVNKQGIREVEIC